MRAPTGLLPQSLLATVWSKVLLVDLALIAAIWCIGAIVVNPVADFPLNDDFSYSRAVLNLIETGDYRPLGFVSMTLFTHVLWGALFSLPAGFSFTAVRLSVLAAGLLGLLGTYILVRDVQQPRWLALVITLTLGFNPAYFLLSYTFMTDVPFVTLTVWSAVFLARSVRSGSGIQMLAGTVLAAVATLSRQMALAIPLSFAITMLLRPELTIRAAMRVIVPLVVCVVTLLSFSYWLEITGRAPIIYASLSGRIVERLANIWSPWGLVDTFAIFAFFSPIYLGLFLLPFFLFCARRLFWSDEMKNLLWSNRKGALALAAAGILTMTWGAVHLAEMDYRILLPMPDKGNMLGRAGLGPFTLRDWIVLNFDDHLALLPSAFWIVLTVMGVAGAVMLIVKLSVHAADLMTRLLSRRQSIGSDEAVSMFLILCGFVSLVPFLFYGFYDRYLILLLPFLATGFLGVSGKFSERFLDDGKALRLIACVFLVAWGVISISGTRDYLTWNAVRWQALRDLMKDEHVGPEDIDGGTEFNGLYLYDPDYKADPSGLNTRSSYWVHRDTYQVGFGVVPGYTVMKEYSYQHWFPPHVQKIVVMRKEEVSSPHVDTKR